MSTVSICAPSRAHAPEPLRGHLVVRGRFGDELERLGQRLRHALAQRARERGGVLERDLLAVERVPDLFGAVARLAPLGEQRVELGARRAVAGGHAGPPSHPHGAVDAVRREAERR